MHFRYQLAAVSFFLSLMGFSTMAEAASTIEIVRDRGYVRCGVTARMPGFSTLNKQGIWFGFNVDFCKGLAAAVLGDGDAIKVQDNWLESLNARDVDVLHASSTWTLKRDTEMDINFTNPVFYDGQGFIATKHLGVTKLGEAVKIKNIRVCAISGTSTAAGNLVEFIKKSGASWNVIIIKTMDGMWKAFFGGRCDMAIHDRTSLMTVLADRLEGSKDFVVFPEVISKEPLSPAVRSDDLEWEEIVRWVTFAVIEAEELGITAANVDEMQASELPEVQRILGVHGEIGKGLGLDNKWAYRTIKAVGNYGEIFDRNLGQGSKFKLERGLNNLWNQGGLMISPPFR